MLVCRRLDASTVLLLFWCVISAAGGAPQRGAIATFSSLRVMMLLPPLVVAVC